MNKKLNRELMGYAEGILQSEDCPLYKDQEKKIINASYNSQVSAFGVSILMVGLKATLSVYYQDKNRKCLLEVMIKMMNRMNHTPYEGSKAFVREVMSCTDTNQEEQWKTCLLNCSVALKQVIRTYNLVDNERSE